MTNVSNRTLAQFRDERAFVNVRRDGLKDFPIYGFIVSFSDELIVTLEIDDFLPDGYLVVRREDISSVEETDSSEFQKEMLEIDGALDESLFQFRDPAESYDVLLRSRSADEIVILEEEPEDYFLIGRVLSADSEWVSIRYFDGEGVWDEKPWDIETERITICKLQTRYAKAFERHFERVANRG